MARALQFSHYLKRNNEKFNEHEQKVICYELEARIYHHLLKYVNAAFVMLLTYMPQAMTDPTRYTDYVPKIVVNCFWLAMFCCVCFLLLPVHMNVHFSDSSLNGNEFFHSHNLCLLSFWHILCKSTSHKIAVTKHCVII